MGNQTGGFDGKDDGVDRSRAFPSSSKKRGRGKESRGFGADDEKNITFERSKVDLAFEFWKENVASMDRSQQQVLGLLLFSALFKKSKDARNLFTSTNIQKQSLRLLDMFGWLLRSLNSTSSQMRARTLISLGDRHVAYGVKPEYFEPMFDALHDALAEMFEEEYTEEVADAIRQLFRQAGQTMMAPKVATTDEDASGSAKPGQPRFLHSLDLCLADPVGFGHLTTFLNTPCKRGELAEFHRAYQIYRSTLNASVRRLIAIEVMNVFFSRDSPLYLTKCHPGKDHLESQMQRCDKLGNDYPLSMFDGVHKWVTTQIEAVAWTDFQEAVLQQLEQQR